MSDYEKDKDYASVDAAPALEEQRQGEEQQEVFKANVDGENYRSKPLSQYARMRSRLTMRY